GLGRAFAMHAVGLARILGPGPPAVDEMPARFEADVVLPVGPQVVHRAFGKGNLRVRKPVPADGKDAVAHRKDEAGSVEGDAGDAVVDETRRFAVTGADGRQRARSLA